jgi:hypothetical protein
VARAGEVRELAAFARDTFGRIDMWWALRQAVQALF